MEKRKWLWKRKSSERSPGETDSSGSFSSHSERYSDEQDALRESPQDCTLSPEVTSKVMTTDDEMKESVKCLTEKLSAALVNVSAKEDLVKQHAKVAEEAVDGWEKAENEVAALKQQLEAAVQQNLNLEVRASHLDGALKECVRQLRQSKDDQEKRIADAMVEKIREWESSKSELEKRILELQEEAEAEKSEISASFDLKFDALEKENSSLKQKLVSLCNELEMVTIEKELSIQAAETASKVQLESILELQEEAEAEKSEISASFDLKFDALEKENSSLKQKLLSLCNELEMVTIERELSIQAAETASKVQLESIKKVAKLEAECKKLLLLARKSNNPKSVGSSAFYAESLTDSHSDSGERLNNIETNGSNCSDSWANALIAELDNFKNEKPVNKNLASAYSIEIDMMDDFLEMERLVALPETKTNTPITVSESASGESVSMESSVKTELDLMIQRVAELEKKLEIIEAEKIELENALDESDGSLQAAQGRVAEAKFKLEELQKELTAVNEAKELLEFQLIGMEVETRTMSANVNSLKVEIEKERKLSAERAIKCQELESELIRTIQESEFQQNTSSNGELKLKQEDLAVAADKLAECQKTIASLGMQLKSLATLEDFLIDTSNIPGFSKISRDEIGSHLENGSSDESPSSSSQSTSSAVHMIDAKSRNGFGRFFNRSKNVVELGNHHE